MSDRACNPALRVITVPVGARAGVSAYADDVSMFVSCRNDIEVVQKALERYKKVTRAKINRNKYSYIFIIVIIQRNLEETLSSLARLENCF